MQPHRYGVFTPVVSDWAFVGEPNKYVTASSIRFPSVAGQGASGITAQVRPCASRDLGG